MNTLTSILLLSFIPSADAEPVILIKGGTLYDGTAKPGVKGDLAIQGERILKTIPKKVDRVIDATGLIVTPGFIDLHTHSDRPVTRAATSTNLNYLLQGVTTAVTGNCGAGPTDMKKYIKQMEEVGQGCNVVHLMPHNAIRNRVMGNVNREPTKEELKKMQDIVDEGMRNGAWGMSTGLIYNPGTYAKTDELIALAKIVSKHKGLYASHIRNEALAVVAATQEAIDIGKAANVPVHISHMKASGHLSWGKSADTIALIQKVRKAGQRVTADQYPYVASSTSLQATLVPTRFREGTRKDFLAKLDDKDLGPKIKKGIADTLKVKREGVAIRIASYSPRRDWQGKTLANIAKVEKKSVLEIVLEIERNGGAGIVNFNMSDEDLHMIMRQDFVATASDGGAKVPDDTVPHPRSYGCFPRKISRYALKERIISLAHALRSANGLPASILQMKDRGYLKPGYVADIVIFDPKKIRDTATFDQPHQYAVGMEYVFVNGKLAIEKGRYTGIKPGKILRP